jgi:VCBS repeat-containing protein
VHDFIPAGSPPEFEVHIDGVVPCVDYNIAAIGANSGNQAANQICASGDLNCNVDRLDAATYNALSPADLAATYDVLIFTWASSSTVNADWATRIRPYLELGGGVIFEDNVNVGELAPAISGTAAGGGTSNVIAMVPGLTDGITNQFANNHITFSSWQAGFEPFLELASGSNPITGVYGGLAGGCMVATGPDQDFHANRGGPGFESNQYNLLINEIEWVAAGGCFAPPVANDDAYVATEDEVLEVGAPGVLLNDTDEDSDPGDLSAVLDTDGTWGTVALNADGSFSYTPDANYCGPDSFTYHANDGMQDSNIATVSIDVTCVNDAPTVVSVTPAQQTSDYSDYIGRVTIVATDIDSTSLTLSQTGAPAAIPNPDLNTTTVCVVVPNDTAADGSECTWTMDGQVLDPGDNVHDIVFTANDGLADSDPESDLNDTHVLTVEPEDATVTQDPSNVVAVEVAEEGGDSGVFALYFSAVETQPDLAGIGTPEHGDLGLMVPFMELVPVGPGGPVDGVCDFIDPLPNEADGYAQVAMFECVFDAVPVNTYEVVARVDGASDTTRYYAGSDDGGVLVVYDPSLGFTTGGGWFYWPGTADPELLTCGEGGYPGDKTNFGFNMKYNKKMTNVQGSLLLQRHTVDANCEGAGKYRVKSNALNGLSIGEANDGTSDYGWASFSGKSVFSEPNADSEGNHPFLVYVEDHGDQGGSQDPADEFWIEVQDKDGNVVLEVNGPDSVPAGEDGADGDDTPIHNGNIVVPH